MVLILNIYKLFFIICKLVSWRIINTLNFFVFIFLISRFSQKLFIWHLILIRLRQGYRLFYDYFVILIYFSDFESGIKRCIIKHVRMMRVLLVLLKFFWDSHNVLSIKLHDLSFLFYLVEIKSVFKKNNICSWIILRLRWMWIMFRFVLGTEFLVYINNIFILNAFFRTWDKIFSINFDWSFFYVIFSLKPTLFLLRRDIWTLNQILIP